MGAETTCTVTFKGKESTAKARLETNVLQIRGAELKLDVPFNAMEKVFARSGSLSISYGGGALRLALGGTAARWAERILHPPSRLTKLGVRPEWRTSLVGDVDEDFIMELRASVASWSVDRVLKNSDAIFLALNGPADLRRLDTLRRSLKPNGALWIIRPKGHAAITEGMVMAAGKAAGLVDVKVVAFSPSHSSLKFVIPVKDRPR